MRSVIGLAALCSYLVALALVRGDEQEAVTCGSAVKITHLQSNHMLHSIEAKFNAGSGQRIVSFTSEKAHHDSLFLIREAHDTPQCIAGEAIKCGDTIRMTHLFSNNNLHTHRVRSLLMGKHDGQAQEVTVFGHNGEGDGGDNWMVHCDGEQWIRGEKVKFMHVDTGKYLSATSEFNFNENNCRGCPLVGHLEAFAAWPFDEVRIGFKAELGVHIYEG